MGRIVKIKNLHDANILDNEGADEMVEKAVREMEVARAYGAAGRGKQLDGGGASNEESSCTIVEDGDAGGASAAPHRDAGGASDRAAKKKKEKRRRESSSAGGEDGRRDRRRSYPILEKHEINEQVRIAIDENIWGYYPTWGYYPPSRVG